MFNDKITKKIAESVKEVLEAKGESYFDSDIPPVAKRLPDSAMPKKKVTRKAKTRKQLEAEKAPLVQTGQGDYTKKVMPSDVSTGPVLDVPETARKVGKAVRAIKNLISKKKS